MSSRLLLSSLFSATLLAACGGGGDGAAAPAPTGGAAAPAATPASAPASAPATPAGTDPGSVSALFEKGDNSAAVRVDGLGGFSGGALSGFTQVQSGGAVTSINGATLGLPATVMDIHGDATYAMGRWVAGAVTGSSTFTLSESGSNAYHYILFNKPATLPTTGALACDAGTFTTPTYLGGTAVSQSQWRGHVTGSAQASFSSAGAAVKLKIVVSNSASAGSNDYSTNVAQGTAVSFAGRSLGQGQPSAWVGLGQAATGYDIVGSYIAATGNGSTYTGVYRFHCQ